MTEFNWPTNEAILLEQDMQEQSDTCPIGSWIWCWEENENK